MTFAKDGARPCDNILPISSNWGRRRELLHSRAGKDKNYYEAILKTEHRVQ